MGNTNSDVKEYGSSLVHELMVLVTIPTFTTLGTLGVRELRDYLYWEPLVYQLEKNENVPLIFIVFGLSFVHRWKRFMRKRYFTERPTGNEEEQVIFFMHRPEMLGFRMCINAAVMILLLRYTTATYNLNMLREKLTPESLPEAQIYFTVTLMLSIVQFTYLFSILLFLFMIPAARKIAQVINDYVIGAADVAQLESEYDLYMN